MRCCWHWRTYAAGEGGGEERSPLWVPKKGIFFFELQEFGIFFFRKFLQILVQSGLNSMRKLLITGSTFKNIFKKFFAPPVPYLHQSYVRHCLLDL